MKYDEIQNIRKNRSKSVEVDMEKMDNNKIFMAMKYGLKNQMNDDMVLMDSSK